eukprot:CAMPEP_0206462326 /NCGR_PEP_ID=MMETSP0324_2-20121206/25920_1 /ASSEMBLY_ACC=CAM_ASM_000836 /TAXON_ID=2866 /ORGANISM="Crypthecodinium cohnii, Strain Seligo" /LENGTH=709 /DNA_ID=CAMNT_0053934477 /DNA_START=60 /DNA_END=2189 /DNA_ORIENTATION=-
MVKGGSRGKWVPKEPAAETPAVPAEEPTIEYDTKHEGPHYTKNQLLRILQLYKNSKDQAIVKELETIGVAERVGAAEPEAKVPGTRRALAEQKKALKKRSASGLDDGEAGEGEAMTASNSDTTQAYMKWIQNLSMMYQMQFNQMQMQMTSQATTVMLRNIPNRYTRDLLVKQLDQEYKGEYDFVYLPIDFNSKCNVGYAFINFRQPQVAAKFMRQWHGAECAKVLPGFDSNKIVEVCYARVQGRDQNMENLRVEKFIEKLTEHEPWQPLFLNDKGEEMPFEETLGKKSTDKKKKGGKTGATPTTPGQAASPNFMMPPTPAMWNPYMLNTVPPAPPPVKLSTLLPKATEKTFLFVKGVPQKVTREALLEILKTKYKGGIDFLFLPKDTKTEDGNRGHFFVNFKKAGLAAKFQEAYNGKPISEFFEGEEEEKTIEVTPGRMESVEKSIVQLQGNKGKKGSGKSSDSYLPVLVKNDGGPKPLPEIGPSKQAEASASAAAAPAGKGKGKGKGKDGAAAYQQAPMPYPYGYYPGYPSYPPQWSNPRGYAGYAALHNAHAYAASAAAMHAGGAPPTNAAAAAGGGGGGGGFLENLGAAMKTTGRPAKPLNADAKEAMKMQIEYYFSPDNLVADLYLRQHMKADGWTSLDLIATFNKVKKFNTTVESIAEALAASDVLEVDAKNRQVRLKNEEQRQKWAKAASDLLEAATKDGAKA